MSMNLEAFLKIWDSEEEITYHPTFFDWMEETYSNPYPFWEGLFKLPQKDYPSPSKSTPFIEYDFYHEAILKNLSKDQIALKILSEDGEECWSYIKIHQAVNQQLPKWSDVGNKVALILPYGIDYIVALLTAIRLKKEFIVLPIHDPLLGKELLSKHLSNFQPSNIVTTEPFQEEVSNLAKIPIHILSIETPLSTEENRETFPYSTGEPFLWGLSVDHFFLSYYRDAFITLRLKKGVSWAQPLTSPSLIEPAMTLTALFGGTTLIYVPDSILIAHPKRIAKEEVSVLGVSSRLQKLWTHAPGAPSSVKLWHKSPLASNPYDWITFMEQNKLTKMRQADLHFSPKEGGITLMSKPKVYRGLSPITQNLGIPWTLKGTREDWGTFMIERDLPEIPKLTLARMGNEWNLYGGTEPIYHESFYPVKNVEDAIRSLSFILAPCIIPEKHPKDLLSHAITLLIFHSPEKKEEEV